MSESPQMPSGDFRLFVQKIAMQGFYALGLVDVPGMGKPDEPNVEMARAVIADLEMLREKCGGNLDEGERFTLDKFISDLQLAVVERSNASS